MEEAYRIQGENKPRTTNDERRKKVRGTRYEGRRNVGNSLEIRSIRSIGNWLYNCSHKDKPPNLR